MDRVGRYELLGVVAERPHGRVWKGHDPELDRDVAVKQVQLSDAEALARLRAEAATLASLDDPHVVTVYDVLEADEGVWLVEQWIDGASLGAVAAQAPRLSSAQAVGVISGALSGLAGAHQRGIVHGDVSPGNILIDQHGTSALIDFGLAAPVGQPGVSGTPGYLSPEALRGENLSTSSDVYSAAAVLATLLLGHPVFPTTTGGETLARQLDPGPPELSGVEPHLREVLARALQADPAQRHQDAAELLADLEQAAERDLGPGWLTQAGVAGLVTAAVTAGGVRLAGSAAASSGSGAPEPAPTVAPTAARKHRISAKAAGFAGAAAVVVVVAIVTAAVAGSGDKSTPAAAASPTATAIVVTAAPTTTTPAPTPSATASPSTAPSPSVTTPSPSPTHPPLTPAQLFAGRYRLTQVITSHFGPDKGSPPVGSKPATVTWRVTASCKPTCHATAKSSSGSTWRFTYAKGHWSGPGGFIYCTDANGAVIPGSSIPDEGRAVVAVPTTSSAATPHKLTAVVTYTVRKASPLCSDLVVGSGWVQKATLTRY